MIFDTNSHMNLTSSDVIVADESYDCSFGAAQIMIENARNDYEMFKAMLTADYTELSMHNAGYMTEAEAIEAVKKTAKNIWDKLVKLIRKFAAKIKGVFQTLKAKFTSIIKSGAELYKTNKKYIDSGAADDVTIKQWCEIKTDIKTVASRCYSSSLSTAVSNYYTDTTEGIQSNIISKSNFESWDKISEGFCSEVFEEPTEVKFGAIKITVKDVITSHKIADEIDSICSDYDDMVKKFIKDTETTSKNTDSASDANEFYTVYQVLQTYYTKVANAAQAALAKHVKQCNAALKVACLHGKFAKESAMIDAIWEEAEEEVDEVIATAADKDDPDVEDVSLADTEVKDSDVSDCPAELTYDKTDCYSEDEDDGKPDGEVDITINSREEAASYFSELLY